MADPLDNLIPGGHKLTKEEQSAGGKKSGEVRKLKKTMKMALIEALEKDNGKGQTYQELVNFGLIKGALKGNALNYKTIVEMLGELEPSKDNITPEININVVDNSNLEKYMYNKE